MTDHAVALPLRAPGRGAARRAAGVALALVLAVIGAACSPSSAAGPGGTLRLGYFPNVTHGSALVGVESGAFKDALGSDVTLETATFNAGGTAAEALLNGAIDVTYIGPNPAINAFAQSNGAAIRIIAGATSGGAYLVVRPGIETAEDLRGTTLATPQLGNTQDVALRTWLADQGLQADLTGGGDVSIRPQENAQTLQTFQTGEIDGAWVPEPWATRLVQEADGKVLVDEADLWPDGRYVTTHLIARTDYLAAHPDIIRALLEGHVAATDRVIDDPDAASELANKGIEGITGNRIADEVMASAWDHLTFTVDPVASSLRTSADHAVAAGLLDPVSLDGIYDLKLLNEVLTSLDRPTVEDR